MSEEILINVTPQETRVARVESGIVQELLIERTRCRGLLGNIYKGRVSRVLPGMEAAFVDIGLERAAFLHVSDVLPDREETDAGIGPPPRTITDLLSEDQEVLVQVVKDPLGTKGARLTTQITVASHFLVYMPSAQNVGVSTKIDDDTERTRLRQLVFNQAGLDTGQAGQRGGFIIRTAAESATETALQQDIEFLRRLWHSVRAQAEASPPGTVVHEDLPLSLRTLRDLVGSQIERLRVDDAETYQHMVAFAERFVPEVAHLIDLYRGERPMFDLYSVEDEVQKALYRRVVLKSGGYVVIDQTESMTTIDVNTGAFVGHRTLEETIFKTNLEAAQAIARQLRLRNLGGIIIIDFIDMSQAEHKRQVLRALEKSLARDHAKSHICEVSPLGLVEMTRKRTRESLEHILCEPCPTCAGRGSVKTAETVCYEIFREILRESRLYEVQKLLVLASQSVIDRLLDEESATLAELEERVGTSIKLQVEALYTQEQFDVVLL